jgi:hypothetical protein
MSQMDISLYPINRFTVFVEIWHWETSTKSYGSFPMFSHIIIIIFLNWKCVLPGGSGTAIRHNTQITHITQNNTPHSNKTQHTKLHKQ